MRLDFKLDEDIFSNDIHYFFSIHGPRFEHMNKLMADSLRKKYKKQFKPISIYNAWPNEIYGKSNYIVVNERSYKLSKELDKHVVYLSDYEDINEEFSRNLIVNKVAKQLLKKQKNIFVYPFTTAFLQPPLQEFTVLGPNNELARNLDNKVNQFKLFNKLCLPCNNSRIFESIEDLKEHEHEIVPSYKSASYTSGGNESSLIYSTEMLHEFLSKLRIINKHNSFVVSEIFEDIVLAPNVNAIVTSDGKVYILVLSDQILQGNRYLGNTYPSLASKQNIQEIYDITNKIGVYLTGQGYRGLFGCDFLINKAGDLVVVDLNPRHQGGYVCNGLALQNMNISMTDMELAVLNDEEINLSQQALDKYHGFAWSHNKITPPEKGISIKNGYHKGEINLPFENVGKNFITQFYKEGSVFIDGYIGYQVQTSINREELEAEALHHRELFDLEVFGL